MMADFRALCAELLDWAEVTAAHYIQLPAVMLRARAALADEPPVPEGREPAAVITEPSDAEGPSIEDVEELCEEHCFNVEGYESIECLQGLINEAIARWGHQPAPPADGEVAEFVEWLQEEADDYECIGCEDSAAKCKRVAELLERQVLVPVSVSERLPGPEVCVPHPRTKRGNWCWGFERCEVSLARPARWRLMHMEAVEMEASHWLPAHALPLPEVGE